MPLAFETFHILAVVEQSGAVGDGAPWIFPKDPPLWDTSVLETVVRSLWRENNRGGLFILPAGNRKSQALCGKKRCPVSLQKAGT